MQEAARIVRGNIKPITELNAQNFDALFMPGGYGVIKNLSDFALEGEGMTVQQDVAKVIKDFHGKQKYIGAICIAPMLLAKVLGEKSGGPGVKLTLGCKGKLWPYKDSIDVASSFGNTLEEHDANSICHDQANKIISSPAFMRSNATPADAYESVKMVVDAVVLALQGKKSGQGPLAIIVNIEIALPYIDEFLKIMEADTTGSR